MATKFEIQATCSFCEWVTPYRDDTPAEYADQRKQLLKHLIECPSHPMRFLINACTQSEIDAMAIADQLDRWANESRAGGWSTHQVEPMQRLAANIRAYPGRRDAIAKIKDLMAPRSSASSAVKTS